ncbi:MAG TPA: hypothetical protein VMT18_15960 [Planctomycetota bacterium]|nr:hypothetical protein [Planctomycetota bacterium]
MNDLRAILRQLEGCLQEEIGAQARAAERLEAQAEALRSGAADVLGQRGAELERELAAAPARAERRATLLRALATFWKVDVKSLRLSSIALRAGDEGRRLERLRVELRAATARSARATRRNALVARLHQRAWSEVLEGALCALAGQESLPGGQLVDAEA